MERRSALLLSFLLTALLAFNFHFFSNTPSQLETVVITRIIDGDTIELEDSRIVRLANINAPEKHIPNSHLSTEYLQQFLNSTVQLEQMGLGMYGRTLGRIYAPEYINLELVDLGLASKFLVENSELKAFSAAEKKAAKEEKGIWKKSPYANCLHNKTRKNQTVYSLCLPCLLCFHNHSSNPKKIMTRR
jgi:endonuclease YncB( thermonuclease family)